MITKKTSSLEMASSDENNCRKLFENYIAVNVSESIGIVFLGVLAILLLIALQRSYALRICQPGRNPI